MFEMSIRTKTYLVFGVMVGCFGILYPKIFHPMLLHLMGWSHTDGKLDETLLHPRERMIKEGKSHPGSYPPHTRPHPGMRASESRKQAAPVGGKGGGIMSMVLPVYAVGIVLYLIYTLSKVFGNSGSANKEKDATKNPRLGNYYQTIQQHYDDVLGAYQTQEGEGEPEQQDMTRGEDDEDATWPRRSQERPQPRPPQDKGMNGRYSTQNKQSKALPKNLDRLLTKVDEKNITDNEMRELRQRLEDTERQMTQILMAMKQVQGDGDSQQPDSVRPSANLSQMGGLSGADMAVSSDAEPTEDEDEEIVTASEGEDMDLPDKESTLVHRRDNAENVKQETEVSS